jgi:hypothetical protein
MGAEVSAILSSTGGSDTASEGYSQVWAKDLRDHLKLRGPKNHSFLNAMGLAWVHQEPLSTVREGLQWRHLG